MWSKITVIAVILMLGAGFFAYNNYKAVEAEIKLRDERASTLERTNKNIESEEAQIASIEAETAKIETECNDLDQKHSELVAANSELSSSIATKTADLEDMTKKLQDMEEKSRGMQNVEELIADIERTEQDNIALDETLKATTARRDALLASISQIENGISHVTKLETEQRARISPESLTTTIREVYDDWGFVVVSGGADSGVVLGSKLAVFRNGEKLAELLVNNVESGKASADIIPSSKSPNVKLHAGDVVKAVRPE